MFQRKLFASPIKFDLRIADDGNAIFQELASTGGSEPLEVSSVYIKSLYNSSGDNPRVKVAIGEFVIPNAKEQTFAEFSKYSRTKRQYFLENPAEDSANRLTVEGSFSRQDDCVPGFDYGCNHIEPRLNIRSSKVIAAHFLVDVTLTGFYPKQRVIGYILLELMRP
jgi:hypothetical protein